MRDDSSYEWVPYWARRGGESRSSRRGVGTFLYDLTIIGSGFAGAVILLRLLASTLTD